MSVVKSVFFFFFLVEKSGFPYTHSFPSLLYGQWLPVFLFHLSPFLFYFYFSFKPATSGRHWVTRRRPQDVGPVLSSGLESPVVSFSLTIVGGPVHAHPEHWPTSISRCFAVLGSETAIPVWTRSEKSVHLYICPSSQIGDPNSLPLSLSLCSQIWGRKQKKSGIYNNMEYRKLKDQVLLLLFACTSLSSHRVKSAVIFRKLK